MFLVNTAEQRFWKFDQPILFLGEWCKLYGQRRVWEGLKHETLPYHWDDRKRLYRDYLYLEGLYEEVLKGLSVALNTIHGVNRSMRHWRIIIGPWLFIFMQIFYDRYQSITAAQGSGKAHGTCIAEYPYGQWIPRDFSEFMGWFEKDEYNQFLYSWIIRATGKINFETLRVHGDIGAHSEYNAVGRRPFSVKKACRRSMRSLVAMIPDRFGKIVSISSYMKRSEIFRLILSLGQFPHTSLPEVEYPGPDVNRDMRSELVFGPGRDEFEKLLGTVIKDQMPSLYVEGYKSMLKLSIDSFPKEPKVILTGNAYYAVESFKYWAAHQVERGSRLAIMQHGGFYGMGLWSTTESLESKIADRYYTWGWKGEGSGSKPLPAVRLHEILRQKPRPRKNGRILLALCTMPRYAYHMHSFCVASTGTLSYFEDQYNLVRRLSVKNRKLLLARLYRFDCGWDQKGRWNDKFPDVESYFGDKPMSEHMKESRLYVATYNGTNFLEALVADFPAIMFWNPEHWELRPEARGYFEELRRAGIFHDSPGSAAEKINEIADDPQAWWRRPDVQAAKDKFCERYAHISTDWLKKWNAELKELMDSI